MMNKKAINRRDFIKKTTITTAALAAGLKAGPAYAGKGKSRVGRKVIIIGIDGMDPVLSEKMIRSGGLPNFARLAESGGFRTLGTSTPPQSPVAWANFINGAGPGSHGIFDFIHRNPEMQCLPFFAAAETVAGNGYLAVGDHKLQLEFWPFNHESSKTLLRRQGVPFWDYLDRAGISSTFYDLPSNYPPSPSKYGNHRCLAGMGTPDLLGTYGTYQHYSEDGPVRTKDEPGGKRSMLFFENERAPAKLFGPTNTLLKEPQPTTVNFVVHRDKQAQGAVIEIQGHKVLLKKGQWSRWLKIDFELSMPWFLPNEHVSGICRFYLQEVEPNFRLYASPVNTDPSDAYLKITEPAEFIGDISDKLGLFYTTGFQEDHKALSNKIFTDAEYAAQAGYVLKERFNLLDYALKDFDDGLLFFYFSSTDLQSHMFWWDSDEKHPVRSASDAKDYFAHLQSIYQKLDSTVGDIAKRYGNEATIIVMSDHGFANFKRQFNLNTWLRDNGYLGPADSTSVLGDVDWSQTRAYGLGINGLYVNLRGRERDGIVEPGTEKEELVNELVTKLEAVRDTNGKPVIRKAHRTDKAYQGPATRLAPDIIIGYRRGYRASWATCLGDMTEEVMLENDSAWSADHCADVLEVPGVVFANRPIAAQTPALIDIAPSVLTEFGLEVPASMQGKNIFKV
ncbi:MAG TPA: twin-arginine translocation signal domain-containing protein [Planctomycetes bacterium]|nr:twin-arginine translocation signal domain-containing protein [Planctomycetota bacterium]